MYILLLLGRSSLSTVDVPTSFTASIYAYRSIKMKRDYKIIRK